MCTVAQMGLAKSEFTLMKQEKFDPETLALRALGFIASDDEAIGGFLGAYGADLDTVRARAKDPEFLGFVLDYLLSEDQSVIAFAEAERIDPMDVMRARAALPGGDTPNWT